MWVVFVTMVIDIDNVTSDGATYGWYGLQNKKNDLPVLTLITQDVIMVNLSRNIPYDRRL